MDLYDIQNLFLHCRIIHKNICVYTIHGGKEAWSTRYQDQYFEILYRQPRRAFLALLTRG